MLEFGEELKYRSNTVCFLRFGENKLFFFSKSTLNLILAFNTCLFKLTGESPLIKVVKSKLTPNCDPLKNSHHLCDTSSSNLKYPNVTYDRTASKRFESYPRSLAFQKFRVTCTPY